GLENLEAVLAKEVRHRSTKSCVIVRHRHGQSRHVRRRNCATLGPVLFPTVPQRHQRLRVARKMITGAGAHRGSRAQDTADQTCRRRRRRKPNASATARSAALPAAPRLEAPAAQPHPLWSPPPDGAVTTSATVAAWVA